MHPFNELRNHKVQKNRVPTLTSGYATGIPHTDAKQDAAQIREMVKPTALKMRADGGAVVARADRPGRARGGKVGKKAGTTVNVIVSPSKPAMPAVPPEMAAGAMPPPPMAKPPMMPPGPPGGLPPGAGGLAGPPMPMRARGGKVIGANNVGAARGRTPVQHSPGKNDLKDMNRGPVITKAKGGAISSGEGSSSKGMAPAVPGGNGGLGRLAKARNQKRHGG